MLRDPDRAIRKLAQEGTLIKIGKGVYKYDPDFVKKRELDDFTQAQKEAIMKRDRSLQDFCAQVLEVYEKNSINGHIVWKR